MGIMRVKHLKRMKYRNLRPGCPVTCRHKNCLMTYRSHPNAPSYS
ncbi:hypothetical protein AB205_0023050 [Aquarana catesbeiana]|uniref:Uncharacterized protein n=1 Tax=Aquarana catesbeiana TaxID=8400 RepID=A0A2G9RNA7_AQUCT|nr:hypothetical protein AB205_0023050 [Aquarana catesbeiana]